MHANTVFDLLCHDLRRRKMVAISFKRACKMCFSGKLPTRYRGCQICLCHLVKIYCAQKCVQCAIFDLCFYCASAT